MPELFRSYGQNDEMLSESLFSCRDVLKLESFIIGAAAAKAKYFSSANAIMKAWQLCHPYIEKKWEYVWVLMKKEMKIFRGEKNFEGGG